MLLDRFTDARIVIIDDTPANVVLLEAMLRRAGVSNVHTLTDPRLAVELVAEVDPDVVLLDLHMPHRDGFAVLGDLVRRAAGSYQPVLVLTADTTAESSQRALAEGARDFITKPFDTTEVLLRVGNLLESRYLHQELRRVNNNLSGRLDHFLHQEAADRVARHTMRDQVRAALTGEAIQMVFQPVVELTPGTVLGYEALARFNLEPRRSPDKWFTDASAVGLGAVLELATLTLALDALPQLPPSAFLAVNISPETLLQPALQDLVNKDIAPRLVLELTEHVPVEDYDPILLAFGLLRSRGVRVAVDDTGAGFASLRHILALTPDIIKLDLSLVHGIDRDPARRALGAALVAFAADTDTLVIAEGVETADELAALTDLGIRWGQGFHLGRPAPLPQTQLTPLSLPSL